ncbi:hypothetical protein [Nocardia inohanensis]|uniref:hypothetical protein n=1 Tax=Nocardia inohanensis TaxID=209246 RepID=UPI00082CAA86|nr:hypothetical protein [Nocardia inohanensis]
MTTTATPTGTERHRTATHEEPDNTVVRWPDPSPLRPWWESIMASAMPADPAVPRSPDPRHPHARNPFLRSCAPTRAVAYR